MSDKSQIRCGNPRCAERISKYGEGYHRVYDLPQKYVMTHPAFPNATAACQSCGAFLVDGVWILKCHKCGKVLPMGERLVALFVPHLCPECHTAETEAARKSGDICRMCGATRNNCCC